MAFLTKKKKKSYAIWYSRQEWLDETCAMLNPAK
jgi:hypothetical protein